MSNNYKWANIINAVEFTFKPKYRVPNDATTATITCSDSDTADNHVEIY